MPQNPVRYDSSNMFRQAVGLHGASAEEIKAYAPRLAEAKQNLLREWKRKEQGWLGCPDDRRAVDAVIRLAKRKQAFKTCLVLGIGGSDLGARAAFQALKHKARGMQLVFAGANTDPDELKEILSGLDLKTTLVNIISKSGDTVEPMSAFLIVRDELKKAVGKKFAVHIVATTDAKGGSLRALAKKEGYATLPVPANIGGRFSVLTFVGLFPLACAGIDVKSLLSGAKAIRSQFQTQTPEKNQICLFSLLHVLADRERRQNIHVLMPYGARLQEFGKWYRQIWAESLGKKTDLAGDHVNVGPTPIAALGATDQHSQIQLYNEGPNNKVLTFIEISKFASRLSIPASAKQFKSLSYLTGISLQKIIHAERAATAEALRQNRRPNGTLFIPQTDARSLGALFMFFEIATALAGRLYGINPYDQSGVEQGKAEMRRLLGGR